MYFFFQNPTSYLPSPNKDIELQCGDKGLFLGLNYKPIYTVCINYIFVFLLPNTLYLFYNNCTCRLNLMMVQ